MWNDQRHARFFLVFSFAFRLIYALRFSYLHPDEHLQGPQEIMHGTYGWASQTPWEFSNEKPVRSFVPLCLLYGIPAGFFKADIDPVYVLYTLRAVFAVLTWVLEDMAVDRLARSRNDRFRCLFFVSTSYVTLTWQAHTLSNSFETILVLWCLVIIFEAESLAKLSAQSPMDRHYDSFVFGVLVVLGIFNRPTFLAFLLLPSLKLLRHWYRCPPEVFTFITSAVLTCAACIYVDTFLYGDEQGWVITPLNFIKYNMSSENLSEHGLHNRFTHLLVNLPQLLGPGILLLRPKWFSLPMLSFISALSVLSFFPHQEARFLLPLVPILCTQMDLDQFKSRKVKKIMLNIWFTFNVILGLVMGLFHQAGVVPAQVHIREFDRPATVIWWKTYTPPLWVTGLQSNEVQYAELSPQGQSVSEIEKIIQTVNDNASKQVLTELDLQGADVSVLEKMLAQMPENGQSFYLVAPLAKTKAISNIFAGKDSIKPIWKTFFHLDPAMIDLHDLSTLQLGVGIWNITSLM